MPESASPQGERAGRNEDLALPESASPQGEREQAEESGSASSKAQRAHTNKERCPSGRRSTLGKRVCGSNRTGGSNPPLSAILSSEISDPERRRLGTIAGAKESFQKICRGQRKQIL